VTEQAGIVEPATLTSLDFRRRFSRLFQKVNDSCSNTNMTAPSLARTLYYKTTTTGRRRHRREQQHPSPGKVLVTFVLAVCGIGWVRRIQLPSSSNGISTPVASRVETEKSASSNLVMIETGTTTRHNVSYYHCKSQVSTSTTDEQDGVAATIIANKNRSADLVLLHGSRFTKEEWKSSGILQRFCTTTTNKHQALLSSVTALDLSVTASYEELIETLEDLSRYGSTTSSSSSSSNSPLVQLPLAGLVTPSASGRGVMDGWTTTTITTRNGVAAATLVATVARWIPVASLGVLSMNPQQRAAFTNGKKKAPIILSIHGDRDEPGRRSSFLLQDLAGAIVQEIPGGHPCYLDSPDAFVAAVVAFLGKQPTEQY
jgi:hypothetical protein